MKKLIPILPFGVDEHEGWIEIGDREDSSLIYFVRALDLGGISWESKDIYASLDKA